jgi:ferredoxin-nitrate reductase
MGISTTQMTKLELQTSRPKVSNALITNKVALIKSAEQWDPISKQPMFKSGAVRVRKIKQDMGRQINIQSDEEQSERQAGTINIVTQAIKSGAVFTKKLIPDKEEGEVTIHAKEQQTKAIANVEQAKPEASGLSDHQERKRYLEAWLSTTYKAIKILLEIYSDCLPSIISDVELLSGFQKMHWITEKIEGAVGSYIKAFHVGDLNDTGISAKLRDSLFSGELKGPESYKSLVLLQGLECYLSHLNGLLVALIPASAAMWDEKFTSMATSSVAQVARQLSWVKHEIQVKSPQTLVVPN